VEKRSARFFFSKIEHVIFDHEIIREQRSLTYFFFFSIFLEEQGDKEKEYCSAVTLNA
jgi:hypothetical protein